MNDIEKQKIFELRSKSIGYKAIANILGLSRDAVRSYCKRHGLDGIPSVVPLNIEEQKNQNLICLHCGKTLKTKSRGRQRKFCSDECRRIWWREHPEEKKPKSTACYRITCPNCNKEFISYGNKNRKYDSHNCYIEHRFGRIEDAV